MKPAVLYHVTKTTTAARIKKLGILTGRRSNWVKAGSGERYGKRGEIFAFEHLSDAARWASRMDWDFHTDIGSGKISIVEFLSTPKDWTVDDSDPLSQAGKLGRWLKSTKSIPPNQIVSVRVAARDFLLEKRKDWMP